MTNSNNFFELIERQSQNVDWLNQILKGGDATTVIIDGVEKPSISKDIADKWLPIAAMVQGRQAYETKALLDASGEPPADKPMAEVWNDPTDDNNGLYGWAGTQWTKSPYDGLMAAADALASAEGFLDGEISRWEYVGAEGVKFYIDEPVYFRVKGTALHRLPFPMEFQLERTQLAYVDDDIRDAVTGELILQIVDHANWYNLKPSHKRKVVASNSYSGVWSSPLAVSNVEEAMKSTFEAGILIKDVEFIGGTVEFTFGDGLTDAAYEAFKGSVGYLSDIQPFTTNGKYTLPQGYGLFLDFNKAIDGQALSVELTPNVIQSAANGRRAFIRGTKVLLIAAKTVNGIPSFYGKLAQQAFALWSGKQLISPLKAQQFISQMPLTVPITTKKLSGHDVEFTVPIYCYVSFPVDPLQPKKGQKVLRTNQTFKVVAHENEVVYFDSRQLDATGHLIPQQGSYYSFAENVDDMPYRRIIGWTRSSGWHGVNSTGTSENISKKIDLSHNIFVDDAKKAPSRDNSEVESIYFKAAAGSAWQVYTGSYGATVVEWSEEIKAEIASHGYIELKNLQGIYCDFNRLNASGRVTAFKVSNFDSGESYGRDDSGFLLLGYKRVNSRDLFFGQLKSKIDRFFELNTHPYYAQMDRVAFVQDGSIPSYDSVTRTLTWSDEVIFLTPWMDETGYRRGRVRIKAGSIQFPSDNYYVAWINKSDILSTDDALGVPTEKIRIGRYYESDGWQGDANAIVLGYCSYGRFTRVAFPPTKGTLEYPSEDGTEANSFTQIVVDVLEPTSDRQRVYVNIRDEASTKGNYIRWVFERLTNLDPLQNSDVWHIQRAYVISPDLTSVVKEVITGGENETAILEQGKSDFVGGMAHGDEISLWVNMQVDGIEVDPATPARYHGKVFKVQQHSQLYEEGTQAQVEWFKAWKTWEFSTDGVDISQKLEFQRDAEIHSFYNCFLCIARNQDANSMATTAQYGSVSPYYEKEDLRPSERQIVYYPSPTKAIAFGGGVSYSAEFLEGYEHQDAANTEFNPANNIMFFQKGTGYNKMYFKQGYTQIRTGASTFTRYRYKVNADL